MSTKPLRTHERLRRISSRGFTERPQILLPSRAPLGDSRALRHRGVGARHGVSRASLRKALGVPGNPSVDSAPPVAKALGLRMRACGAVARTKRPHTFAYSAFRAAGRYSLRSAAIAFHLGRTVPPERIRRGRRLGQLSCRPSQNTVFTSLGSMSSRALKLTQTYSPPSCSR